jgi:uncharacterized protein
MRSPTPIAVPDESLQTAGSADAPSRVISPMSDAECRALLDRQRMCTLSLVDGVAPYAVPVFYGFDGEDLYLGVAEGRKTRALDANPRVYVVVTEVGPANAWRSVAIAGCARTLIDSDARQRAIDVLIEHNRRFKAPDAPPAPRRVSGGRLLRVDGSVMTGRSFGW